ncbi:putative histone-lysine N-methyltransferase [Lupinus albus]|uniref:Putative histone-lysine N-methyltransferase n=1 Tax=Lupinus albus TaxID=3870 RepID=A0A6A4QJS2_LUPAL|nr:putative histone-lysine N-methyltransferase [Lupinus albus]
MVNSKAAISSLTHLRPLTYAASATSSYPAQLVPDPPNLIAWVTREGGYVHPALKIAHSHHFNGLGLVSNQQIPAGTNLIILPDHIPLSFRSFESEDSVDYALAQLARQVPEELWAMKLGLKLLQDRAKVGSFWWPYISNLPQTYSVPIFFPGEDIKNLQYAPVLHQVNKRCRFLLDFEQEIKRTLVNLEPDKHPFGGLEVHASSLGWAMSAVSSRAFLLYGNNDQMESTLMYP